MKYAWDITSLVIFFLGGILLFRGCAQEEENANFNSKVDSILIKVNILTNKVNKADTAVQKAKLLNAEHFSEIKNVRNEFNTTIQKINITPDSLQFHVTKDLLSKHRQLDSQERHSQGN